jgi:hypothetical protein
MGTQTKGLFLIKVEYAGELCLLGNIQRASDRFIADKLVQGGEMSSMTIDFNQITFPSSTAIPRTNNRNKLLFLDLFNALQNTLFNHQENRLNAGFGVVNGEVNQLINCPEKYGKEPLLNVLFERVQSKKVSWATLFYFKTSDVNHQMGIGVDILHPQQCSHLFIPMTSQTLEGGDLYYCLDTSLTQLVDKSVGIAVVLEEEEDVDQDAANDANVKSHRERNGIQHKANENIQQIKNKLGVYLKQCSAWFNHNSLIYKSLLPVFGALIVIVIVFMSNSTTDPEFKSVNANTLRVRAQPSEDAEVLNRLIRGQVVVVNETEADWSLIQSEDVTGWVSSKYLVDKQETE